MDTDLTESIAAFRGAFPALSEPPLGEGDASLIEVLKTKFSLPPRYCKFLLTCEPQDDAELVTPAERLLLLSADQLDEEQKGFATDDSGTLIPHPSTNAWRPSWIIIGHSSLLGDPYFLEVADADAEGDCPVYTAMSGTEAWQKQLCASSFAMFLRILAVSVELAKDFDLDDYDQDNEQLFRDSLGPKIRQYDPAAVKAGHWT